MIVEIYKYNSDEFLLDIDIKRLKGNFNEKSYVYNYFREYIPIAEEKEIVDILFDKKTPDHHIEGIMLALLGISTSQQPYYEGFLKKFSQQYPYLKIIISNSGTEVDIHKKIEPYPKKSSTVYRVVNSSGTNIYGNEKRKVMTKALNFHRAVAKATH